jgi:serine/threonine protein kinase
MPWEERYKVALGVARAIQYLHFGTDKCVIHRDIKPSNILLSSRKNPKVSSIVGHHKTPNLLVYNCFFFLLSLHPLYVKPF